MHVRAGVAVIATNTLAAIKGKELLNITWDEGKRNTDSTEQLFKTFEEKAKQKPQFEVLNKGETFGVL